MRGRLVVPTLNTDANDQHHQLVSGMGAFANALMGSMKQMHESNMQMFNQVLGGKGRLADLRGAEQGVGMLGVALPVPYQRRLSP